MTIVGFSLSKILFERSNSPIKKVEIKSKLHLSSMDKQEVILIEGKDTLKFNFEYDIEYLPNLAKIAFKGYILFVSDPKQTNEILEKWKKDKTLDKVIQTGVYNFIFQKCNIKALQFEDEFNLPPHIQLPLIKLKDIKEKSQIN